MEPRTEVEYRAILKRAMPDGTLKPEVKAWGRSPCIVLRAALRWSAEQGMRPKADAEALRDQVPDWRRKRKKKPVAPDVGMVAAYLDEAEKLDPVEHALAVLPYYMAFRARELLSLQRGRIISALKHGDLSFTRKGNKGATLPITKDAEPYFKLLLASPKEWATVGELLTKKSPAAQTVAYWRLVRKTGDAVKDKGMQYKWHPHALRHAWARAKRKKRWPLKQIQSWLGHDNISTTDIYMGNEDAVDWDEQQSDEATP